MSVQQVTFINRLNAENVFTAKKNERKGTRSSSSRNYYNTLLIFHKFLLNQKHFITLL